ncbi:MULTISPECIES: DEDDh family exonuclease [Streptomyces]|uniref:DEDDh family exonuclease n=1 Tax=Streptomyces caniscabiei TaxID=2746961 RepID=A0ABU4MF14_9ACTN|nr:MULTISPECIES: DEDDh family exonuclease [Streptomyces]MBE4736301.1 DEDDh family exonuclease [Streptomyces caniscabiei]MBE4755571.1 DEDDh family exonuclease [Streptomyces caniscabiei]MBE4774331.1 DEDDh family exonuclease [Streptomyces caniscabiei]MBE4785732.1 DEDDh family exonuclease [Streptomyces caniscabiei]MBE4793753.1 DEDDh family exonuclease [Streptomyces caniscabiei]
MLEDHTTAASQAPWPAAYPQGYAVVDVETTGLARDDRIISAAVYRLDARGEVEDHWYTLVNPERDPGPVWIHGLTSDVLEGAPLFKEIAEEFSSRLADRVLVAHNAVFDWSMIAREYARAETEAPVRQRLCTIALSKELALPLPNHKLESLAAHFGVVQQRAHHALDDARVLAEAFRPSLRAAAAGGVRLPLHECRPLTEWRDSPATPRIGQQAGHGGGQGGGYGAYRPTSWRPSRKRPACPYPNPGRFEDGKPLKQGMRVAFSGDTSIERDLLEDRAIEAGLHVATTLSRVTSLLVTNDPDSNTSKVVKARQYGTPVVDEAAFGQLLRDVAPADE